MSNQSEKPLECLFTHLLKLRFRKSESQLAGNTDRNSTILKAVLHETNQNYLSPEEKEWIGRIEALRNIINISTEKIPVMDYGAGKSWLIPDK